MALLRQNDHFIIYMPYFIIICIMPLPDLHKTTHITFLE